MMKLTIGLVLCTLALPAYAQEAEEMASEAEAAKLAETLAKIGCKAGAVEKESAELFEVDDAECAIGQYDVKLDGAFNIISITKDF